MHRGRVIFNRFLDTNMLWVVISLVLAAAAPVFHFLAIQFDLYGNPPHMDLRIDVYTHSVSAIAVVALLLNLNLGEKKRRSWGIPIAIALTVGVLWEGFEEIVIRLDLIAFYNSPWNAVQDVFIDLLGGIVAAFFYDVVVEHGRHPGEAVSIPEQKRDDPGRSEEETGEPQDEQLGVELGLMLGELAAEVGT